MGAKESMNIKYSFIVLGYNNWKMTEKTILSLQESLSLENITEYEVILVDNDSTDETTIESHKLVKNQSRIVYVHSEYNRGYAGGMNLGIQRALGQIIFLLNNDLQFTHEWCSPIIEAFERDPSVGAVGPLTNSAGNWQQINLRNWSTQGTHSWKFNLLSAFGGKYIEMNNLGFFCVAIHRKVFDSIGLLDENYGIGMFEDDDFCLRMRLASFKLQVSEGSFVYHHGSASFKLLTTNTYSTLWVRNSKYFEDKFRMKLLPNRDFIDYSFCHNRDVLYGTQLSLDLLRKKLRRSDWTKICLKEFIRVLDVNGFKIAFKNIKHYGGMTFLFRVFIFLVPILIHKSKSRLKFSISDATSLESRLRNTYVKLHFNFWRIMKGLVFIRDCSILLYKLIRRGFLFPSTKFVVFPQTVDFDFMKQRPQQLALAFADAGYIAIYFTTNSQSDRIDVFKCVGDRSIVINYRLRIALRILNLHRDTIFYCIWPTNHFYLEYFRPKKIVYDICDSLELLKDASGKEGGIQSLHTELCSSADLITYSARNLREIIPDSRKEKSLYLPNAVSQSFVDIASIHSPSLNKQNQFKLVYFGYLSKWVDFDLLQKYSNLLSVGEVSIFGSVDSKFKENFELFLDRNKKIKYYGEVSNIEIAQRLHEFDVGLIPFLSNTITDSVSPVKLFEYAAGSLPTLTFYNNEMPKCSGVFIYRTHEEALDLLDQILESRSIGMQDSLRLFSVENLWAHRVELVLKTLMQ